MVQMRTLTPFLAAFLLACLTLGAFAGVQAKSEDRREVHVVASATEAVIELRNPSDENEDKVVARFSTRDGHLDVRYVSEIDETEYQKSLATQMVRLLEFRDQDGDDAFDEGEPIASGYLLSPQSANSSFRAEDAEKANGTVAWGPILVSDVEEDDRDGKRVTARGAFVRSQPTVPTLPLPPLPGQVRESYFQVDLYAFGDRLTHRGVTLEPTEIEIAFTVHNYTFMEENTRLAFVLESMAEDNLATESDIIPAGEDGVLTTQRLPGRDVAVLFTWEESSEVDGETELARTSMLKSERKEIRDQNGTDEVELRLYALNYPRGANVVHDAVLGVSYSLQEQARGLFGGGAAPGLPAVVVVAALLGGAALAMHARRR